MGSYSKKNVNRQIIISHDDESSNFGAIVSTGPSLTYYNCWLTHCQTIQVEKIWLH